MTKLSADCTEKVRGNPGDSEVLPIPSQRYRNVFHQNRRNRGKWKSTPLGQPCCRKEPETQEVQGLLILSQELPDKSLCPWGKIKSWRKESGSGPEGTGPKLRSTCMWGMTEAKMLMACLVQVAKESRHIALELRRTLLFGRWEVLALLDFWCWRKEPRALCMSSKSSTVGLLPQCHPAGILEG